MSADNANANGMKLWQVGDSDWMVARTGEEAIAAYKDLVGFDDDDIEEGYPAEMDAAYLDREVPEYDEDERKTGRMVTARKYLDEHKGTTAEWFWGHE